MTNRYIGDTSYTWHLTVWKSGSIFSGQVTPVVAPEVTPGHIGRPWNIYERPIFFYERPWNFHERLVRFGLWAWNIVTRINNDKFETNLNNYYNSSFVSIFLPRISRISRIWLRVVNLNEFHEWNRKRFLAGASQLLRALVSLRQVSFNSLNSWSL